MPAAGSKGAPKIHGEIKDDTSSSREEKQVKVSFLLDNEFIRTYVISISFYACMNLNLFADQVRKQKEKKS